MSIYEASKPIVSVGARERRLDPQRVIGTIVLLAWCALFWFLMLSDRTSLYLSSRTDWIVPVGALITTVAGIGRLLTLRSHDPRPVTSRDAFAMSVLIVPIVVVLALPPATLGSFAASRRSTLSGGYVTSVEDIVNGELSLADVGGALRSRDAMRALSDRAGTSVEFVGFVNRDEGTPADEFTLTRFLISCCVADALSVEVRVVGAPPGRFKNDDWVRVEGRLYPLNNEVVVDASEVVGVPRPDEPYLNP
jgi:uncharacterized repeat protein (TIGR03943 family)